MRGKRATLFFCVLFCAGADFSTTTLSAPLGMKIDNKHTQFRCGRVFCRALGRFWLLLPLPLPEFLSPPSPWSDPARLLAPPLNIQIFEFGQWYGLFFKNQCLKLNPFTISDQNSMRKRYMLMFKVQNTREKPTCCFLLCTSSSLLK